MSLINWAGPHSGNWGDGSDWVGGVTPGINDTAVIDATGRAYAIDLTYSVTVGGVELDYAKAKLYVTSSLAFTNFALQAGTLELRGGTLSGTVADTAGILTIGAASTSVLDNVTWQGALDPIYLAPATHHPYGTLTIDNSLTLTGAGGTGPGSADFSGVVVLNNVASLDNATITAGTLLLASSNLTFGAGLTLDADIKWLSAGTLTNDGMLTVGGLIVGGSGVDGMFVNNGTCVTSGIYDGTDRGVTVNNGLIEMSDATASLNDSFDSSLTNNGTIVVGSGQFIELNYPALPTETAHGQIDLDGGALIVDNGSDSAFTTADLLAIISTQHVTATETSGFGLGIRGGLDNTGSVLAIGAGTSLGTISSFFENGSIVGGTIDYQGNLPVYAGVLAQSYPEDYTYLNLQSLTINSASSTLDLGQTMLQDVLVTGASTVDIGVGIIAFGEPTVGTITGGTLSGVGTLNVGVPGPLVSGGIALDGVDITGVGGSGNVQVNVSSGATLDVTNQAIAGYTFNLTSGELYTNGTPINDVTINIDASAGFYSTINCAAFGAAVQVNAAAGSISQWVPSTSRGICNISGYVVFDGGFANMGTMDVSSTGTLVNEYFTNSGTVKVNGGELVYTPSTFTNTGSVSVIDGTIVMVGSLTTSSFHLIKHTGSAFVAAGFLDLGGKTVSLTDLGAQNLTLGDPTFIYAAALSDGTLKIGQGEDMSVTGSATISANLINDGTIYSTAAPDSVNAPLTLSGTISGDGTFDVGGAYAVVDISSTVSAGQTIAFAGVGGTLSLTTQAATTDFAATVGGFSVGDTLALELNAPGQTDVTLTSGAILGDSISLTLSNSVTMAIATTSPLAGSLQISNWGGIGYVTYESTTPSMHDWLGADYARFDIGPHSHDPGAFMATLPNVEFDHSGFLLLHQLA